MPLLKTTSVTRWFESRFGNPTPAQRAAWPLIERGSNVLIVSPTGTGKTLAAFLSVLNERALVQEGGTPPHPIFCIYVAPWRALIYPRKKNRREPLQQIYGE